MSFFAEDLYLRENRMELKEPQLQWHWRRQTLLLAEHLLKIKAEAAAKGEKVHFYILPHHRADGDAIGSAMALQRALCREGFAAQAVFAEPLSGLYDYLDCRDYAVCATAEEAECWRERIIREKAYVCLVDNSAPSTRLGAREVLFNACLPARRIIIDHHISQFTASAAYDIAPDIVACCVQVSELLLALEAAENCHLIDKNTAECLMTGIVTDSGQLSYEAMSAQVYLIMAILKNRGADQELINRLHYHLCSRRQLQIEALAFTQTKYFFANRCLVAKLSAAQIQAVQATDQDIDGISSKLREVEGVEIAVLLRQTPKGNVIGSIRTSLTADAQKIALQLGGGGHKRASGFTIYNSTPEAAEPLFLQACREQLERTDESGEQ